jgi:prepilin-type processing-associated H-X9-DG protein
MFTGNYDLQRGWDKVTQKVLLFDPVRVPGWIVSGGRYDLNGAVIHNNSGVLPVLMLDGHVLQFDRMDMKLQPSLPELINRIYEQL